MPRQAKFPGIADKYRELILEGRLKPNTQLPTVEELAGREGVASATAAKVYAALQVEGLVRISHRGVFVSDEHGVTLVGLDRLSRIRRGLPYLVEGESAYVNSAEVVTPPAYVADLFDLDPSLARVLRREYVIGRSTHRLMLVVDWMPAEAAVLAPSLLKTNPSGVNQAVALYLKVSGRVITSARDDMHARRASGREAAQLLVATGSPVLGHVSRWWDDDGVIVYSEAVLPEREVIGYQTMPPDQLELVD
jgi:GntR family transcriptional regulator